MSLLSSSYTTQFLFPIIRFHFISLISDRISLVAILSAAHIELTGILFPIVVGDLTGNSRWLVPVGVGSFLGPSVFSCPHRSVVIRLSHG